MSICAVFLVVTAMAIALGASLSSSDDPPAPATNSSIIVVVGSDAPSVSMEPSSLPSPHPTAPPSGTHSTAPSSLPSIRPTVSSSDFPSAIPTAPPSSSVPPSLPPTICAMKIASNAEKIDVRVDFVPSVFHRVAMDGRNMVVATTNSYETLASFYSLGNDGKWVITSTFAQPNQATSIALSGNVAFVGNLFANDMEGDVKVYERKKFGFWELVNDPFVRSVAAHRQNGRKVFVDGDLACVIDEINTNFFRRERNKWMQLGTIADDGVGQWCSIAGDVIVMGARIDADTGIAIEKEFYLHFFVYDEDLGEVAPIQDPISTGNVNTYRMDLSPDHLAYWDDYENDVVIYSRHRETSQTFELLQRINIPGLSPRSNNRLALDKDVLVVGGFEKTHIFFAQNGAWEETITLNRRYQIYQIHDRMLIGLTEVNELYSFNIEDCAQELPTQAPSYSLSSSPSANPSSSQPPSSSSFPSATASPSQFPSTSSMPSMTPLNALFDADCISPCFPQVAIHGDKAVVTRAYADIQFFLLTGSGFELITKIDVDFRPSSVAIHGRTAVVGALFENAYTGVVYFFSQDRDGTWYTARRIVPEDIRRGAEFGRSFDIDDDVVVVGAPHDGEEGRGSLYVYRRDETTWLQEAKIFPPNDSTVNFGWSVSVKGDTIVVGDAWYGDGDKGAVFVYEYDSSSESWNTPGDALVYDDCPARFGGFFLRLMDNEELLISCMMSYIDYGTVHYYEKQRPENGYVLQQSIHFDGGVPSADVEEDVMVVSEYKAGSGRNDVIHFFVRKNHAWERVNRIDNPDIDAEFGWRVALSGNTNTTLVASYTNVYIVEDYFN